MKSRVLRAGSRAVAVAVAAAALVTGVPLAAHAADDSKPLNLYYNPGDGSEAAIGGVDLTWATVVSPRFTYTEGDSPAVLGSTIGYKVVQAYAFLVPQGTADPRDTSTWVDSVQVAVTAISTPNTREVQYVRAPLTLNAWVDASIQNSGGSYDLGVVFTVRNASPVQVDPDIPDVWTVPITIQPGGAWTAEATTVEPTAPAAPAAPSVTPGVDSLAVSWTAPETGGSDITGYTVHVYADGTEVTSQAATETSTTVTGLTQGTAYEVGVVATNAVGDSPESARTPATTLVPGQRDVIADVPETAVDGQLVLDVPAGAANLGEAVQQADNSFVASGKLGQVSVDDQREVTKKGWTLQAQVADFTGPQALSQAQLGWTPMIVESGTTATGVVTGDAQAAGSGTATRTFAEAQAGSGVGVTNLDADLTFKAPAGTAKGTYTAKVVITVTSK